MFTLTRPSDTGLKRFLEEQSRLPFTYPGVGATRPGPPLVVGRGYDIDRRRTLLGMGESVYRRADRALHEWRMFEVGWLNLLWPTTAIEKHATMGVLMHRFGLWSLHAARVAYTLRTSGEVERAGFAWGTLPTHAECGEERFLVEWRREDDTVWYEILAFSRPHHALARAGKPLARWLQRRFALDSLAAMRRACAEPP